MYRSRPYNEKSFLFQPKDIVFSVTYDVEKLLISHPHNMAALTTMCDPEAVHEMDGLIRLLQYLILSHSSNISKVSSLRSLYFRLKELVTKAVVQ